MPPLDIGQNQTILERFQNASRQLGGQPLHQHDLSHTLDLGYGKGHNPCCDPVKNPHHRQAVNPRKTLFMDFPQLFPHIYETWTLMHKLLVRVKVPHPFLEFISDCPMNVPSKGVVELRYVKLL